MGVKRQAQMAVRRSLLARFEARRARVFRDTFAIGPATRILDLGGSDGARIQRLVPGHRNIWVAEIDPVNVQRAERRGLHGLLVDPHGRIPIDDGFFDVVHCNSVIEHVTVPRAEVWDCVDGFDRRARAAQERFAAEIKRVGRRYFVQTPNRWFPVEAHTWLPLLGWLPRRWQIAAIRLANRFWVKPSAPDFRLLDAHQLAELFPEARIVRERVAGLTKSLIAIG